MQAVHYVLLRRANLPNHKYMVMTMHVTVSILSTAVFLYF